MTTARSDSPLTPAQTIATEAASQLAAVSKPGLHPGNARAIFDNESEQEPHAAADTPPHDQRFTTSHSNRRPTIPQCHPKGPPTLRSRPPRHTLPPGSPSELSNRPEIWSPPPPLESCHNVEAPCTTFSCFYRIKRRVRRHAPTLNVCTRAPNNDSKLIMMQCYAFVPWSSGGAEWSGVVRMEAQQKTTGASAVKMLPGERLPLTEGGGMTCGRFMGLVSALSNESCGTGAVVRSQHGDRGRWVARRKTSTLHAATRIPTQKRIAEKRTSRFDDGKQPREGTFVQFKRLLYYRLPFSRCDDLQLHQSIQDRRAVRGCPVRRRIKAHAAEEGVSHR